MQPVEEKQPITDTYIEDYEEFLDEDDRWRPGPHKDRRHAVRPPEEGKKR